MLKASFLEKGREDINCTEPLRYLEFWKTRDAVYYFLKGRTKSSDEFP